MQELICFKESKKKHFMSNFCLKDEWMNNELCVMLFFASKLPAFVPSTVCWHMSLLLYICAVNYMCCHTHTHNLSLKWVRSFPSGFNPLPQISLQRQAKNIKDFILLTYFVWIENFNKMTINRLCFPEIYILLFFLKDVFIKVHYLKIWNWITFFKKSNWTESFFL